MTAPKVTVIDPRGPRWRGYLVSRSAIMHGGANRVGNVVPFNVEPVAVPGRGVLQVPTISGNSIRHQLREAAAHLYLSLLRPIRLPPKLYYVLFSGGANQGGDGGHFDFDERSELMRMVPPVAVFGTARDGGTYAGAVAVSSAQPAARETWDLLQPPRPSSTWPCGAVEASAIADRVWGQKRTSALRMLAEQQYTRTDSLRTRSPAYVLGGSAATVVEVAEPPKGKRGKGKAGAEAKPAPHQMIFSAQVLVRGVALVHELAFLQPADELTRSCFGAAVEQWSQSPTVGGRAALGHGLVEPAYDSPLPDSAQFMAYMREHREQIRSYLARKHGAVLDEVVQDARSDVQDGPGEAGDDGDESE